MSATVSTRARQICSRTAEAKEVDTVPIKAIHHVDLAVRDVERSLAFYLAVLGPLGVKEDCRFRSYRGTEEVVYLSIGDQLLGLRPADGG